MIEYEVEIGERPLGVRFAHADRGETVVVHLVLENKVGHKLGLLPGDILISINGESVLEKSSSEALEEFRRQELPFKASFRRFEDDDDFDSDEEENSDTELQSVYNMQREDAHYIQHQLESQPMKHHRNLSVTMKEWTNDDVCEWLVNYGKSEYNDDQRFNKYQKLFKQENIDGAILRNLNQQGLIELGVDKNDVQDLYFGIQQLRNINYSNGVKYHSYFAILRHLFVYY